ncbi:MAG: flavodoxin domain-containing protein [Eubacteriales bacterium]|nr:flavodoxin domain-containing protein [Eubacteriales bacterium]
MKGLVLYKSRTGFTKTYATWIAEELGYDLFDHTRLTPDFIAAYDCVIYGGRVHAGSIDNIKKVKALFANNAHPKLIVFATGASPIDATEQIDGVWKANFSEEEAASIPHFYLPSGLNYEKMGFGDRLLMKMLVKVLNAKKDKTDYEIGFSKAIASSYDHSSKEYIQDLLACARSLAV